MINNINNNKISKHQKEERKKIKKKSLKLLHEELGHLSLKEIKKLGYDISNEEIKILNVMCAVKENRIERNLREIYL